MGCLNPDLTGYRRDNLLGQPHIHLLETNSFERMYDQQMSHENKPRRNQLKIPRKLHSAEQINLMQQRIKTPLKTEA